VRVHSIWQGGARIGRRRGREAIGSHLDVKVKVALQVEVGVKLKGEEGMKVKVSWV